jgi:hypothetical protein
MLSACATAVLCLACPAFAGDLCRLAPWGEMGQSGVLGFYYGGGLRCSTDHLVLTLGERSTQLGGNVFQPVAGISYTNLLRDNLTFSVKTTLRERNGDYEVNALPELSVAWNLPHRDHEVQVTETATWGSYAVTTVPVIIQRTQLRVSANWPSWRFAPGVDAGFSLTGAYNAYSTGDTQAYVEAGFGLWGKLGTFVDWSWGVGDRNGVGVTPLKFDGNSGDAWTYAGLTFHVSPKWDVSVRGTYNFYSATMSSVNLEVRTTAFGDRAIAFNYDATGGTLTGTYDVPQFGNVGLRYEQARSSVYLFFEPR